MRRGTSLVTIFLGAFVFVPNAAADCEIDVSHYVGWTMAYSGTVTGYRDPDGVRSDDFEGCEYDRISGSRAQLVFVPAASD